MTMVCVNSHFVHSKYTQWLLGSSTFVLLSMFDFLQSVCATLVLTLKLCVLLFLVSEGGEGDGEEGIVTCVYQNKNKCFN